MSCIQFFKKFSCFYARNVIWASLIWHMDYQSSHPTGLVASSLSSWQSLLNSGTGAIVTSHPLLCSTLYNASPFHASKRQDFTIIYKSLAIPPKILWLHLLLFSPLLSIPTHTSLLAMSSTHSYLWAFPLAVLTIWNFPLISNGEFHCLCKVSSQISPQKSPPY